jgi:hypothetical protein
VPHEIHQKRQPQAHDEEELGRDENLGVFVRFPLERLFQLGVDVVQPLDHSSESLLVNQAKKYCHYCRNVVTDVENQVG